MTTFVIDNVQNICNLFGREENNIGGIVFLVSILYSLTQKTNIQFPAGEKIEYSFIKNKLTVI